MSVTSEMTRVQQRAGQDDGLAGLLGEHFLHLLCEADAVENDEIDLLHGTDFLCGLLESWPVSVGRSCHTGAFLDIAAPFLVILL